MVNKKVNISFAEYVYHVYVYIFVHLNHVKDQYGGIWLVKLRQSAPQYKCQYNLLEYA